MESITLFCSSDCDGANFGVARLGAPGRRIGFRDEVPPHQAVWPSKCPVLGIFFCSCEVIFAVSRSPGTPRGPSFLRAISSSVSRSSSRVAGRLLRLHGFWMLHG